MNDDYPSATEQATAAPGERRNLPELRTVGPGDRLPEGHWRIVDIIDDRIVLERTR